MQPELKTIRSLRKAKGMTQWDLALKLNVDQAAVSNWERGISRPLRKMMEPLAKALGVTVEELSASLPGHPHN